MNQASLTDLQWIARAAVAFLWLFTLAKLMGQHQIGELTLFDFIVSMTMGSAFASTLSTSTAGLKNVANLNDVEFAILEPNGKMSVIPKSQARPVAPSEIGYSIRGYHDSPD